MSENKSENQGISHWLDIGNTRINMGEVVMIQFSEEKAKPIVLHLKSGQNIIIQNTTSDMNDRELFEHLFDYLNTIAESEDRLKTDSFELLKSILSELELISGKL